MTYEITGNWEYDKIQINKKFNKNNFLLIDGLSILIWRILTSDLDMDERLKIKQIDYLIDFLCNDFDNWVVVDVDQPYPLSDETRPFIDLLCLCHAKIELISKVHKVVIPTK